MPTAEAVQARILAANREDAVGQPPPVRHIVDLVTIALALVSIIFAYVQKLDSRDLKSRTELLVSGATTRYLGEFPNSIPGITEIVQDTCDGIDIMTDVPGYGQYSSPGEFYKYLSSILDEAHSSVETNFNTHHCDGKELASRPDSRAPQIRLLLYSPELRRQYLYRQFPKESFVAMLKDPRNNSERQKFLEFFRKNPNLLDPKMTPESFLEKVQGGTGYDSFAELLLENHRNHEKQLRQAGVQIRYATQPFIIRLWVQDHEEAAFSFDHSEETEIAFRTRDTKLLDDFTRTFSEQWGQATDYTEYWKNHAFN